MKKKILFVLFAAAMLTVLFAISVSAVELREIWDISKTKEDSVTASIYENENSYFVLNISGTGQMKDWEGTMRAPWRSYYGSKIIDVVIEDGVTNVGESAFTGCSFLRNVKLSSSTIEIGNVAFLDCVMLESVELPKGVISIGEAAFQNCDSLTSFTIPSGVKTIKNYAFCTCDNLVEVFIKDGVTIIGDWAFSNCTSLTMVTMSNSVEEMGDGCFFGCGSLLNIELHQCIIVGNKAFGECHTLSIYCESESQPDGWDDGWNPDNRPVVWGYFGKEGCLDDIFTFKGYSFGLAGQISVGFDIDYEALAKYEAKTGRVVEIGVLFAGYDNLGGKQPLDENGQATKLDVGKVIKADLTSFAYPSYDFVLNDIVESIRDVKLVISAYICDGECGWYIQENGLSDTVSGVSYNEAKMQ